MTRPSNLCKWQNCARFISNVEGNYCKRHEKKFRGMSEDWKSVEYARVFHLKQKEAQV